ncbi:hypothetical protein EXIGLDRAFT_841464 [Exidia glandulosa HHB12029]|uniref:Transcription factor tau subunit sfc3/Tfc3 C-terminal domain-containing protein n=1 Tax=Exidia glandulosa HHB12029 TaxID=1314781 RepID=A0A165DVX0_EXIGL|nr:hypothetical protein EXIGLDRAFT_841464 [Exidia glandulosa HHB12029]
MDELLDHCMREISFDGDLGCDVSRLNSFVSAFYAESSQNLDDSFHNYVWSLVTAHPNVRVGVLPDGVTGEVAIPARPSKKGGQKDVEVPQLQVIEDAAFTPLPDLVQQYGDKLRVAVDEATAFKTLTGSHIRPAKLSAMVYSCLQLISRGREMGLSVAQLGKSTGYDQKTCHYICQQLLTLDLIVKLPKPGVGTNFVVHKYFVEHSAPWRRLRAEEQDPMLGVIAHYNGAVGSDDDDEGVQHKMPLTFRPMNEMDWSSDALFRARVVALLNVLPGKQIDLNKLLPAVGVESDKPIKRFYAPRIEGMIDDGIVERYELPLNTKRNTTKPIIRLLATVPAPSVMESTTVENGAEVSDESERDEVRDLHRVPAGDQSLQRQMVSLLEEAGEKGLTLNDFIAALGEYDRRTLELLLYRLEKSRHPKHLADLGVVMTLENSGRERRYRYYTVGVYRTIAAKENIELELSDDDDEPQPEYQPVDKADFYVDEEELTTYLKGFNRPIGPGRPKKQGAAPAKDKGKNPFDANGKRIIGRPRKEWTGGESRKPSTNSQVNPLCPPEAGMKRKRGHLEDDEEEEGPPKKKRGRPGRKKKVTEEDDAAAAEEVDELAEDEDEEPVQKRRGRSAKKKANDKPAADEEVKTPKAGKVAGRKPKAKDGGADVEQKETPAKPSDAAGTDVSNDDATPATKPAARKAKETPKAVQVPAPELSTSTSLPPSTANDSGAPAPLEPEPIVISDNSSTEQQQTAAAPVPALAAPAPEVSLAVTASPALATPKTVGTKRQRPQDENENDVTPKPKRARTNDSHSKVRNKVMISQIRRENEFFKLVEKNGAVVAMPRVFLPQYRALLEDMVARGEPISGAAGVDPDTRTMIKTWDNLTSKGRVKSLGTMVANSMGIQIPAKVYYLPNLPQAGLDLFLAELNAGAITPANNVPPKKKTAAAATVAAVAARQSPSVNLGGEHAKRKHKSGALVTQLLATDGIAARSAFLTELQTMRQLFGFLCGKLARARELHLYTLSQLVSDSPLSTHIVSREDRIVTFGFFFHELPLGTYCSLISVVGYEEQLELALRTVEGMNMLVQDLPKDLAVSLQVGKARSKAKILELVSFLVQLDLVIPLVASTSATPEFTCVNPQGHLPTHYDRCESAELKGASFFKFNTDAPLYHFASKQSPAPFIGYTSVLSADVSLGYWRRLKALSLKNSFFEITAETAPPPAVMRTTDKMQRDLMRETCWVDYYVMSWYQKEYLRNQMDPHTGATPLDDPDPNKTRFMQLCYVSCVPINVAQAFYLQEAEAWKQAKTRYSQAAHAEMVARAAGATRKPQRRLSKKETRREADWKAIVDSVPSVAMGEDLTKMLQALKARFMETAMTKKVLERDLRVAIDALQQNRERAWKRAQQPDGHSSSAPLILQSTAVDATSVPELVAMVKTKSEQLGLKELRKPPQSKGRKKKGKQAEEPAEDDNETVEDDGRIRRRKFAWNPQFDELARDLGTILRVRCSGTRMDWGPAQVVFPGLSRVAIKNRITHLREAPGGESYAKRLDEAWRTFWLEHRGTSELPDPNLKSTSDFPIVEHITFLRKYVDKQALKIGGPPVPAATDVQQKATVHPLAKDVDFFARMWTLEEKPRPAHGMKESLFSGVSEEQRERDGLKDAFTLDAIAPPHPVQLPREDMPEVVQAALKMMLATPEDAFNEDIGADMLEHFGDEATKKAAVELLDRNVLAQTVHDVKKLHPGRTLKISDVQRKEYGGWPTSTLCSEGDALDTLNLSDWSEWEVNATDGETAALLRMVANEEVELDIEIPQFAAARETLDWNSRKVDDSQIEGAVSWRPTLQRSSHELDHDEDNVDADMIDEIDLEASAGVDHGFTITGAAACCALESEDGHIDCAGCIQASLTAKWSAAESEEQGKEMMAVLKFAMQAEWRGVTRQQLQTHLFASYGILPDRIWEAVRRLSRAPVPLVFWTGYDTSRLVYSADAARWTAALGKAPGADRNIVERRLPRRWLDIHGDVIKEQWTAGLRAVAGVVHMRPGISTMDLRSKLLSFLDRQELNEILQFMLSKGAVRIVCPDDVSKNPFEVDVADERRVCWFTGRKIAWYRIAALP